MNPAQNYNDGQSGANPDEQAAQCSPFFTSAQDDGQHTIQDHYRKLHQAVEDKMFVSGSSSSIELLKDLWMGWTEERWGQVVPEQKVEIRGTDIDMTYNLMELMCFLAKVGDSWSAIKHLEARYEQNQQADPTSAASVDGASN